MTRPSLALLAGVLAAATLTAGSTASRPLPSSGASPLMAACTAFYEFRQREGGPPAPARLQPLSPDKADDLFRRAEAFGYTGGFQLSGNGATLLSKGYGMADRAREIPITRDTLFDIGSVAKQFTAAAILRLEEMGRLSTQDPIAKHLPGVPPDKRAVTIHHLLTHSSGLPMASAHDRDMIGRAEAVREILGLPLERPPGEKYSYSNVGYALLAAIVETASGEEYEAFLRERLWLPAGLRRTGMALGGLDRARTAESWFFDGAQPASLARMPGRNGRPSWRGMGAGSIVSTLRDLEQWGEALRTGRALSEASRRKLFWPHVREDGERPVYYGYGWSIGAASDGSCRIGHNGSGGLHYAFMSFLPERNALVVAFDTQERSPWNHYADRAWPALFGASSSLPTFVKKSAADLAHLTGDYRLEVGGALPVRLEGNRLFIDTAGADALRLFSPWPLLSGAEIAGLGDRQALMSTVMNGIARRDYAPLLARLRSGTATDEEIEWWRKRWPEWVAEKGRYLGIELAGTVSLPAGTGRPEDRLRSLGLARFERGTIVFGFVHDPDGRIYIDWMPQYFDRRIFLAPQADGGFLSYRPFSKRTISVRFDGDGKAGGRSLTVDNGQEVARARRP
ncbi:MAG TPA: serine hydrolase domain-containing protein [Allosphingosinicella sp.]|jgi:CubicO group peptidase (beta-lactamase class C family)